MSESPKNSNSISRRLINNLIALVVLVVVLVTGGFYWNIVSTNEQAFASKIDGTLTNLRDALSIPLWTIDNSSVKQLGDAMLQGDLVVSVVVQDDDGKTVFAAKNDTSEETILRTIPVHYRETVVGELQLIFSREPLHNEIRKDLTMLAAWGGILLMFGLWIWRLRVEMKLRKQTEKELFRSKEKAESANRAKSTFLANMSHELRTPLNAILGFSEMIGRDHATPAAIQEKVAIINRSGAHLLALINDVLDISKIEAGRTELEPETFDLHRLLHDIDDMFRLRTEAKGLAFILDPQEDLPAYILLDKGKLRQVLINLLGNAIKFTDSGGVTLRAGVEVLSDGKLQLHFEVEDTGTGIPADKTEIIFEAFAQAGHSPVEQQGTGLGLAITRQFIQLMGGEISVESNPGKGSIFRFEIPAEAADARELEQRVEGPIQQVVSLAADEPEWRILIVEDVADNRLLLRSLLESVGFMVREAVNGEEGVQQFKDWQPQLIWMDMGMPVMNGYEATRSIRTLPNGKEVKILALTASVFKEQEPKILAAGCDAVLHKPYNESVIFTAMEKQLGLHYIYEETNELLNQASFSELELEDLQGLPDEWLDEFLTAVQMGDIKVMLSLTNTIAAEHVETKAKLDHYINDFNFLHLVNIIEEKQRSAKKT
jgi:signal transduction histidine kinase/DNA-binding NarL/FixJ family response regulator